MRPVETDETVGMCRLIWIFVCPNVRFLYIAAHNMVLLHKYTSHFIFILVKTFSLYNFSLLQNSERQACALFITLQIFFRESIYLTFALKILNMILLPNSSVYHISAKYKFV